MKVLLINGSPRVGGNTSIALGEMEKIFQQEGIQVETVQVGNKAIRGCVACLSCMEKGKCVFDDLVNETAPKFAEADGLVIASPVYYASANGTLISFIDRLFYSTPFDKTMKVGAAVAVARRGGVSATFPACPLPPASIGTLSMAGKRARPPKTRRACRPCAPWPGTWFS